MIFNQGYSHKHKQLARERIERLKEQNHQEIIIRKQKIKELSKQTNELRKKIKEKSKSQAEEEEERRATILENRKLKQRIATEKFQRIQKKRQVKGRKTSLKNGLKNGFYHVRGHIIEIQNGKRVSSIKHDEAIETFGKTSIQRNTFAPESYLSDHLHNLINNVQKQEIDKVDDLGGSNINDIYADKNANPFLLSKYCNSENMREHPQKRIEASTMRNKSPDGSDCSVDSLEEGGQEQKMLKSSLKLALFKNGLNDSGYRKVTFSDSIEFNDGNTGRLSVETMETVPLYKRIGKNLSESENHLENTSVTPVTAEEALDRLREQVLITKLPQVNDSVFPESVVTEMEKLSRSEWRGLDNGNDTKSDPPAANCQSPESNNGYHEATTDSSEQSFGEEDQSRLCENSVDIRRYEVSNNCEKKKDSMDDNIIESEVKNDQHDSDIPPNSTSYAEPPASESDPGDNIQHSTHPQHSSNSDDHYITTQSENGSEEKPQSIAEEECITTDQQTLKSSDGKFSAYGEQNYENCNHLIEKYSAAETQRNHSIAKYFTSKSDAPTSHTHSSDPHQNESSGMLYVPKYPYFPSKEQRYSANDVYEGRSAGMNYFQSQHGNDPSILSSENGNTSSPSSSIMSFGSNSQNSSNDLRPIPRLPPKTVNTEYDNKKECQGVTKEVSVSYINITARDMSFNQSKAEDLKNPDDIYKEIERTLADLTFANTANAVDEADYSSSQYRHLSEQTEQEIAIYDRGEYKIPINYDDFGQSGEKVISDVTKGKNVALVQPQQNAVQNNSAARRGRIIVSADKKKRKEVGNMMPRPPAKPKVISNSEKNHQVSSDSHKKDISKEKAKKNNIRGADKYGDTRKYGDKIRKKEKQIVNTNNNHPESQVHSQMLSMHQEKEVSEYPSYLPDQYGSQYYRDMNNYSNFDKQADFNNNPPTYVKNPNNLPKSYVRASPNSLPWSKFPESNHTSYVPLDKTPTDDEINKLWTNVRQCIITTETMDHAYSDSNYIIDNQYRKRYRRLSGSSIDKRSSDRLSPRIYGSRQQRYSPGLNQRYGSYESLNSQNVNDNFNPNSTFFNKPSLLPQRATKVIRNSNFTNENKYTLFKGSDKVSGSDRKYQYDTQLEKYSDVSASMASFLVLEELCKKQTLSPRQAEAVFQASKSVQQKHRKEKSDFSALSIEERCVMQSLERLNDRLKEKEMQAGDLKLVSKPPLPDYRRRVYSNH